jgi:hypothetical protein
MHYVGHYTISFQNAWSLQQQQNYWIVHYVFQDTKFKKIRLKCFNLGFE